MDENLFNAIHLASCYRYFIHRRWFVLQSFFGILLQSILLVVWQAMVKTLEELIPLAFSELFSTHLRLGIMRRPPARRCFQCNRRRIAGPGDQCHGLFVQHEVTRTGTRRFGSAPMARWRRLQSLKLSGPGPPAPVLSLPTRMWPGPTRTAGQ